MAGGNRALAGFIARLRGGHYDFKTPSRLKVCPNPSCPRPWRTYVYGNKGKCPFCGTPLEYEEAA